MPSAAAPHEGMLKVSRYGGYSVEFHRSFDVDTKELWRTLTDPERMVDWYADAEVDPSEGGRMVLRFPNSGGVAYAMITELIPEKVFQHMWVTGSSTDPKQPMPQELRDADYKCGDINTAGSVIRFELSEDHSGGTNLVVQHYVPMNPHLIAGSLSKDLASCISLTPMPQMVMASWLCLLELLEGAIKNPGNRAMSLTAERSGSWPWDRHSMFTAELSRTMNSLE